MLPAGEHVREVCLHQGGLIDVTKGAKPLLIDCSTIDVDSARARRGEAREAAGLAMLDAPVSGGTAGAQNGTLTFMVGGTEDGLRARQAGAGGDGQEHLPRRRPGRRAGGEDLQQHDARHQHGRRRRRASCWPRSLAWTGTSCIEICLDRDLEFLGAVELLPGARPGAGARRPTATMRRGSPPR